MKHTIILAVALALFASCEKDDASRIEPRGGSPKTIEAVIDTTSRIELNADGKSVWSSGDKVSVFYKTMGNECYRFTGKTGAFDGVLEWQSGKKSEEQTDKVVGVYPYSEATTIRRDGTVKFVIPDRQQYARESFGAGSSLMIGTSDNSPQMYFRNVMGWLKVSLTGDATIAKIVLKGNMNEPLTGLATVASAITFDGEYGESITLDCGSGVRLSSQPTSFIVAVAPQTFANGFAVTVVDNGGKSMTFKTQKCIAIKRNTIKPMGVKAYAPESGKYTLSRTIPDVVPFNGGKYSVDFVADSATERWLYRVLVDGSSVVSPTAIQTQRAKLNIAIDANYGTDKRDVVVEIGNVGKNVWERAIEVRQESALTRVGDYYWAKGNVCLRDGRFGIADGMADRGLLFRNFSRYGVLTDNNKYTGTAYKPEPVQIKLTDIPTEADYDVCSLISPQLRMPTFAEMDNLRGAEGAIRTDGDGKIVSYRNTAFVLPMHGFMSIEENYLYTSRYTMYVGLGEDSEGTGLVYIIEENDNGGHSSFVDFDYTQSAGNLGFVRCVRNIRQPSYISHTPTDAVGSGEFSLVVNTARGDFDTTYSVEIGVTKANAPSMRKTVDAQGVAQFKVPANTTGENLEWGIFINGRDTGKRIVQSR